MEPKNTIAEYTGLCEKCHWGIFDQCGTKNSFFYGIIIRKGKFFVCDNFADEKTFYEEDKK